MMMQKFLFNKYFSLFTKNSFSSSSIKPTFFDEVKNAIPYNFEGLNVPKSETLKTTKFSLILKYSFDENVEDGFKLAYNSYLDALVERDLEFLKNILEPTFYNKMKAYDEKLTNNELSIEKIHDNSEITIEIIKLVMNIGVKSDRKINNGVKLGNPESSNFLKNILNKSSGIDIELFLPNINDFNPSNPMKISLPIVLQAILSITSKKKLILRGKDGSQPEVNAYENFAQHKLVFECQSLIPVMKLMTSFSMFTSPSSQKDFLFPKGQIEWILSDFDDFMEGNPFGKN